MAAEIRAQDARLPQVRNPRQPGQRPPPRVRIPKKRKLDIPEVYARVKKFHDDQHNKL